MKAIDLLWRKLTASKDLDESGPQENKFFERVYRLVFITGLSYSDNSVPYKLYSISVAVISVTVLILEIWHTITDNLSLDGLISTVNVIIIHIITFWKLITMLSNKQIYKKMAKALESPNFDTSTKKRKDLVNHWANTHKKYLSILLNLANSTLFFWNTYPLVDDEEYNLMVEIHIPLNYHSTGRYIWTYLTMIVMFNTISYLVIMSEVIMQAYLLPLICQYAVLGDCFENVFDECASSFEGIDRNELINDHQFIETYKKRLGNLVNQHLEILNQTMDLKRILSAPLLGQLCSSGMLICFVGYQATATIQENPAKFMMSAGYLGYNMFTLYLICRWCEEITSQSEKIGAAAYCSGWEVGMSKVPGVRDIILIIIVRANKPMVFMAGGMYTISLSSYTNLVKASYSALNILLRMSND